MSDLEVAFDRIDRFVEQRMESVRTPGMSIGLTDRQQLLRVSTYGFADPEARTPVTSDTLFEIGSRQVFLTCTARSPSTYPGSRCARCTGPSISTTC